MILWHLKTFLRFQGILVGNSHEQRGVRMGRSVVKSSLPTREVDSLSSQGWILWERLNTYSYSFTMFFCAFNNDTIISKLLGLHCFLRNLSQPCCGQPSYRRNWRHTRLRAQMKISTGKKIQNHTSILHHISMCTWDSFCSREQDWNNTLSKNKVQNARSHDPITVGGLCKQQNRFLVAMHMYQRRDISQRLNFLSTNELAAH